MTHARPSIWVTSRATAIAFLALLGSPPARAQPGAALLSSEASPDATLKLNEGRLTSDLPYMWGRGRLSFHATRHDFDISGAPLSAERVPSLTATGKVFYLDRLSDFAGKYVRVDQPTGPFIEEGGVAMMNEHGVVILLRVATASANDGPASGSVRIRLKE